MGLKTTIATSILKGLIEKRLNADNKVPVNGRAAEVTAQAAAEAAAPTLVNATNNEPWYKSRVTLGSYFSVLGAISAMGIDLTNGNGLEVEVFAANFAVVLGAGLALYGRWKAKKPLFE